MHHRKLATNEERIKHTHQYRQTLKTCLLILLTFQSVAHPEFYFCLCFLKSAVTPSKYGPREGLKRCLGRREFGGALEHKEWEILE